LSEEKPVQQNVLAELLDLVGRENMPALPREDVESILNAGVSHALKTHLDLMIGGSSERTKAWVAKDWLDRSGLAPVQKVAVREHISFDAKTLEALKRIASEDDDRDGVVREAVVEDAEPGLGSDPGDAAPEVPA
jgi:hypothetical protein